MQDAVEAHFDPGEPGGDKAADADGQATGEDPPNTGGNSKRAGHWRAASVGVDCVEANTRAEALTLIDVLGEEKTPVTAVKAALGDLGACSGLLQTLAAITSLSTRMASPISGLASPAVLGLNYVTQATSLRGDQALVTATTHTGSCSALVLSSAHD